MKRTKGTKTTRLGDALVDAFQLHWARLNGHDSNISYLDKEVRELRDKVAFQETCIDLLVRGEFHPQLADRFYSEARKRTEWKLQSESQS